MNKAFIEFKTKNGNVFINKESVDFVVIQKSDRKEIQEIKVASGGIWITMDFNLADDEAKQLYEEALIEIDGIVRTRSYNRQIVAALK